MKTSKAFLFALLCVLSALFATSAQADDQSTACNDPYVLKSITARFHRQTVNVHDQQIQIDAIARVHQHRFYEKTEFSHYARRYCGATATLSDGRNREVWYLIESNAGLVGLGNNVEFCVSGFDRWNAYNASCRVLR